MATKIIMPKLGMEMTEGAIASWMVKEGEHVDKGQVIVQVETEKINYDVEAPASGILRKILARQAEVLPVGGVLGVIAAHDELLNEQEFIPEGPVPHMAKPEASSRTPHAMKGTGSIPQYEGRIIATPAAKKLAREKGVDLSSVTGTGPQGRITERDVLAVKDVGLAGVERAAETLEIHPGTILPLTHVRSIIAERLTKSWQSPHIYLATEVDASELQAVRMELLPAVERETAHKLAYDDIFLKVVALAIEKWPVLNGTLEASYIRIPKEINIGLAVALEDGLVVPVVRTANEKPLVEIVRARSDLVAKARAHKLELNDLRGGTFSISNLGMFDLDFFTAILNPPQSGILAIGAIKDTPVIVGGEICIRPMVKLTLGVDHRVVDGAVAAGFLQEIKRTLEGLRGQPLSR
jgi:pyruvate dehydrogenase E2 component (dihydrolipoamide acetyltransferase)